MAQPSSSWEGEISELNRENSTGIWLVDYCCYYSYSITVVILLLVLCLLFLRLLLLYCCWYECCYYWYYYWYHSSSHFCQHVVYGLWPWIPYKLNSYDGYIDKSLLMDWWPSIPQNGYTSRLLIIAHTMYYIQVCLKKGDTPYLWHVQYWKWWLIRMG